MGAVYCCFSSLYSICCAKSAIILLTLVLETKYNKKTTEGKFCKKTATRHQITLCMPAVQFD